MGLELCFNLSIPVPSASRAPCVGTPCLPVLLHVYLHVGSYMYGTGTGLVRVGSYYQYRSRINSGSSLELYALIDS